MKSKKLVMGLLSLLAAVCMAFSFIMLSSAQPTVYAASEATAEEFVVLNSASVRTVAGSSGVRYTTRMSEEFYNSVKDNSPEWHTLMAIDEEDETQITVDYEGVIDLTKDDMIIYEEEVDGVKYYQYQTVLSLDGAATDEAQLERYLLNLSARSYVVVGEEITYSYADENSDTHRNATEVAEKVLVEDQLNAKIYDREDMAERKAILKEYVRAIAPVYAIDGVAYLEDFSASTADTISGLGVADGVYDATIGDKTTELTIVGGSATVAQDTFGLTQDQLGETFIVKFLNSNGAYAQAIKYVSKKITSFEEHQTAMRLYTEGQTESNFEVVVNDTNQANFYDSETFTQRYYVLTTDIAFPNDWTDMDSSSTGFFDIYDGQGYTIGGYVNQWGAFGQVGNNSVIKNLKIDVSICEKNTNSEYHYTSIIARRAGVITLENVAVNATWSLAPENWGLFDLTLSNSSTLKDVYVNYGETYSENAHLIGSLWNTHVISFNNVHIVSDITTISARSETEYEGLKTYTEQPAALTSVGDWTIDADGTATWAGKKDTSAKEYAKDQLAPTTTFESNGKVAIEKMGYYIDSTSTDEDRLFLDWYGEYKYYDVTINGKTKNMVLADDGSHTNWPIGHNAFEFTSDDLGQVFMAEIKGTNGTTYVQPVMYVNQVIFQANELLALLNKYRTNCDLEWGGYTKHNPVLGTNSNADGVPANDPALFYDGETFTQRYVVLAKDITIDTTDTNVMSDGRIFADILDGQGHTITATVDKCGLFNLLVSATIKNVGLNITNTSSTSDSQYGIPALAHRSSSAKVINTFINFDLTAETAVGGISPFYDKDQWTNTYALIQNTYLHIDDSVLSDETTGGYLARCAYPEDGFWTQHVQGLYVVSKNVAKPTYASTDYGASNQADATKVWHQMYYYATPAEMIAENASVGSWTINTDGTATWNGSLYNEGELKNMTGSLVTKEYDLSQAFSVTAESATLAVDGTTTIVVADANGLVYEGYVAMDTLDTEVVSIENGVITAVAAGTAQITVAYQVAGQGYSTVITVTVE